MRWLISALLALSLVAGAKAQLAKGMEWEISTNNSSVATLDSALVFTGTGDFIAQYSTVTVFVDTDVDGTLSMQFSTDNTNWDRAKLVVVDQALASGGVHTLEVVAAYFRVVYTNGTVDQGHFRLQTIYHAARSGFLSSSPDQKIDKTTDAQVMRVSNDPFVDLSRNLYADKFSVHKFGYDATVAANPFIVWSASDSLYFPTLYRKVAVYAANAADDAAGANARKVHIFGLDANFDLQDEIVALAGGDTVKTSNVYSRINRAFVTDVGTYGATNLGNIDLRINARRMAQITAGVGQTQSSLYSVPDGHTAYVRHMHAQNKGTSGASKEADIKFWRRENADDQTAPMTAARIFHQWVGVDVSAKTELDLYAMVAITGPADIWVTAEAANATSVDVTYDLIVVKGDTPISPQ